MQCFIFSDYDKKVMIMKWASAISTAVFLCGSSLAIAQDIDLESDAARVGYGIGINIGASIIRDGILDEIELDALVMGIQDAVNQSPKLSQEELTAALQMFAEQQNAKAMAEAEAAAAAAEELAEAGKTYLAENATKAGVMTTESGLQYEVISKGADSSAPRPTASDEVNVHYHGMLIDGSVFDSSVDRGEPVSFRLNAVIPGWTEGLQLMQVGDKYRFVIPSELAYGPQGAGGVIGPNATLIFEVELLGIE